MILKQGLQKQKIKVQISTLLLSSSETLGKVLNFLVRFCFKPYPRICSLTLKREVGGRERERDRERERNIDVREKQRSINQLLPVYTRMGDGTCNLLR